MKADPRARPVRDARIQTRYEGTTQLQIGAAVRGVCSGAFEKRVSTLEGHEYFDTTLNELKAKLSDGKQLVLDGIAFVKTKGVDYMDLYGRKLVDAAVAVLVGHLLLQQAVDNERRRLVVKRFVERNHPHIQADMDLLRSGDVSAMSQYEAIAGPVPVAG